MKLKYYFLLLVITIIFPRILMAQMHNFEFSSGLFSPSKHLFHNNQEASYSRSPSYNFRLVYFADINDGPFSIGLSVQYLRYLRSFDGFVLDQNNPNREQLPNMLKMDMSQNLTLISLFFAYKLKINEKWETQFRLGTGTGAQQSPILNYYYGFATNATSPAYIKFRTKYIENNPKEVSFDELSIKINYHLNNEHSFGLLISRTGQIYNLRRLINSNNEPELEGKKLFNIQTELQVNDKNYFYNHNTLFAGSSFNLTYTYKF